MLGTIVRWVSRATALMVFVAVPAFAQESGRVPVDLHGSVPAVPLGLPGEPLTSWAPPPTARGSWSITALAELAVDPVVLEFQRDQGATFDRDPLLSTVAGANLSARWSLLPRVGVAVTVPVFPYVQTRSDPLAFEVEAGGTLQTGIAVADVRAAVPIALVGSETGEGFGLGLVPWLTVPTGVGSDLMTGAGPAVGATATAGYRSPGAMVVANVGAGAGKGAVVQRVPVRTSRIGSFGLATGVRVVDPGTPRGGDVWALLELRGVTNLGPYADPLPEEVALSIPPIELLASVSGTFGRGWVGAGGGTHVVGGPGAATFRGFVGTGWVHTGEASGIHDEPRVEPVFTFEVHDPRGIPVDGASVYQGSELLGQTTGGKLDVPVVRWNQGIRVEADRLVSEAVSRPPDPEQRIVSVELAWAPSALDARVTDTEGRPVDVLMVATSIDDPSIVFTGDPGTLEVPPGHYRVEMRAEGFATQVREVWVEPDAGPPMPIDAVAIPDQGGDAALAIRILDPEGSPVVGARVLIDGVPIGVTADGGLLQLMGLTAGPHEVVIQHDAFTAEAVSMALSSDATEAPLMLQREPGSVRVVVRGPEGLPVTDAVVRFMGASRLPPMALGPRGERTQVLSAGTWELIVTSEKYGVQEREIVVPPDRWELITVEVVLRPSEAGTAELTLRVVDPSGQPVERATISLDGQEVGATTTGGTVRLTELAVGERSLVVTGDGLMRAESMITLTPGIQDQMAIVPWKEGTVDVVVLGPHGPVDDAQVRFIGDGKLPSVAVGPTGRLRTNVPPGRWTVLVSSAAYGVQERDLEIPVGPGPLQKVEFVLVPIEGGLADLAIRVEGPDDTPIEGASVLLDGALVGKTTGLGSVRLTQLAVGERQLTVRAEGYKERTQSTRLVVGDQKVDVGLDWVSGTVRIRVRHDGKPVPDAVVRLMGEQMRSPMPVDASGERLDHLTPGFWLVLVTSPQFGVAERDLEVKKGVGLTTVDVDMRSLTSDRTDVVVTVIDPAGQAVEHAKVWLDDASLDETEQGGTVIGLGLAPGPVRLRCEAPDFLPSAPLEVVLRPGTVERFTLRLPWVEVPVKVRTVGDDGRAIDATVQWTGGPADIAPLKSGADGEVETVLRPGSWQVYAFVGDLAASGRLNIDLADEPRPLELTLRPSGAVMSGESVTIKEMVQFDFGKASLRPDSDPILLEVARVLLSQPTIVSVQIQGHTDNVGTVAANQALSQLRAEAVVEALVARGVPREVLSASGYGPTKPIADNTTEEGRAQNRRVQFVVDERSASLP